ncbi:nucleotidyltransferase domain-containing protein [Staphylothermus hellenicus]|uniref:DNA polymerase beta domain protein region n=1 Tax=Staphylothermus hellenicus (strain DSM 12710 / JCM 10830 / BK20S6-10-b1 / P8) TaxID=591019 RepID=D7D851_STAHD|nr:nucleotidyltransferase domain-containing protein [Staphylothermus hellenicus]ADI31947.1 DNA polymerase beta domain protein region [Staphylothermus hellenicus DSM 12710]
MSREKVDPLIEEIITDFKNKIEEKLRIKIDEIIVFGSRARGDYRVDSDIDLIIISREWRGTILDRMKHIYKLWNYELDATLIPLKPDELEEKIHSSITLRDARKYWIRIKF